MPHKIVGWDIGGAHLKAVLVDNQGAINRVIQTPCPLWKGTDELQSAVVRIKQEISSDSVLHVLTMTGEMVDYFESREQGVAQILKQMLVSLAAPEVLIFAGRQGLITPQQVHSTPYNLIASANWLASAMYTAQVIPSGIFIDVGSTTTDILSIDNYQLNTASDTDFQRLCSGELIYTGIIRTPVMAITDQVSFQDQQVGIMAEYFATMADVYRLTGELHEHNDQLPAADGQEKSVNASARRLARMIGCDFITQQLPAWRQLAYNIREQQLQKIQQRLIRQLSNNFIQEPVLIGAGVGRFLAVELAARQGCQYRDFNSLFDCSITAEAMQVADCAPAAAIACLALNQGTARN